ncbi:hypothetical protein [Streptomyces sp. NPDC058045]|uniref:hypothetical protein n=1 Tax=Streptomyces sp. NPDC058045 TaxID=3346311 RepID=UPI0036E2A344
MTIDSHPVGSEDRPPAAPAGSPPTHPPREPGIAGRDPAAAPGPVTGRDPVDDLMRSVALGRSLDEVLRLVALLEQSPKRATAATAAVRAAATERPVEEVSRMVALLSRPPHSPARADDAIRAATRHRSLEDVGHLLTLLHQPPHDAHTAEEAIRAATGSRTVEELAQLIARLDPGTPAADRTPATGKGLGEADGAEVTGPSATVTETTAVRESGPGNAPSSATGGSGKPVDATAGDAVDPYRSQHPDGAAPKSAPKSPSASRSTPVTGAPPAEPPASASTAAPGSDGKAAAVKRSEHSGAGRFRGAGARGTRPGTRGASPTGPTPSGPAAGRSATARTPHSASTHPGSKGVDKSRPTRTPDGSAHRSPSQRAPKPASAPPRKPARARRQTPASRTASAVAPSRVLGRPPHGGAPGWLRWPAAVALLACGVTTLPRYGAGVDASLYAGLMTATVLCGVVALALLVLRAGTGVALLAGVVVSGAVTAVHLAPTGRRAPEVTRAVEHTLAPRGLTTVAAAVALVVTLAALAGLVALAHRNRTPSPASPARTGTSTDSSPTPTPETRKAVPSEPAAAEALFTDADAALLADAGSALDPASPPRATHYATGTGPAFTGSPADR